MYVEKRTSGIPSVGNREGKENGQTRDYVVLQAHSFSARSRSKLPCRTPWTKRRLTYVNSRPKCLTIRNEKQVNGPYSCGLPGETATRDKMSKALGIGLEAGVREQTKSSCSNTIFNPQANQTNFSMTTSTIQHDPSVGGIAKRMGRHGNSAAR